MNKCTSCSYKKQTFEHLFVLIKEPSNVVNMRLFQDYIVHMSPARFLGHHAMQKVSSGLVKYRRLSDLWSVQRKILMGGKF